MKHESLPIKPAWQSESSEELLVSESDYLVGYCSDRPHICQEIVKICPKTYDFLCQGYFGSNTEQLIRHISWGELEKLEQLLTELESDQLPEAPVLEALYHKQPDIRALVVTVLNASNPEDHSVYPHCNRARAGDPKALYSNGRQADRYLI